MSPPTARRQSLVATVSRLRSHGLTQAHIAREMGLSQQYVEELLHDPDRERALERREKYRGTCEDCGRKTDGSNGLEHAPKVCTYCHRTRRHEDRFWTKDEIIRALHRWAREHGRQPSATDWKTGGRESGHPDRSIVQREFGTWSAGIEAAGFIPMPWGRPPPERYGLRRKDGAGV